MYWTLGGLYTVIPESRVVALVDHERAGAIVVSPPNAAYNRVAAAGGKADALVDAYLRGHYALPLASVPAVIADAACSIAAYELYFLSDVQDVPEKIKERYKAALSLLTHVREEKIKLFDEDTSTAAAQQTIQVNKTADDRLFPNTVLDQF